MRTPLQHRRQRALAALVLPSVAVLLLIAAVAPRSERTRFDEYHDYRELTAELQRLTRAHSAIARLVEAGESRDGRTIWAVEIANPAGVPVAERPALFIAANFEGDQIVGSELALATIEWLLTSYAGNGEVKRRIDEQAFYIIPRVNPDGAEDLFAAVRSGRRTNLRPYDDDNDARSDEDGPDDLNGDGLITVMRVRDPSGPYMVHPSEPRLMKRADASKGESGGWAIYIEGTDDDGDGFYNEDGLGGVDLNRNWQHEYPYYAPDAGPHMVSEPETRAVIDYLLAHRNVAAILTYGGSDNLVTAPNQRGELAASVELALPGFASASNDEARTVGTFSTAPQFFGFGFGGGGGGGGGQGQDQGGGQGGGRRPATTVNSADLEYFRAISERYRELTGVERLGAARRPAGAFFEYGYYQFGVPSFSTPGWGLPQPQAAEGQEPSTEGARQTPAARGNGGDDDPDVRVLRWFDDAGIDGFVAWTAYRHPQLGDVEIGGFVPHAATNPPYAMITELAPKHAEFALHIATLFPRVRIASTEVTAHGGGVFRIEAEIENTGYLPTAMAQGVTARAVGPVMVQLGVDADDIITGDPKTNFVNALAGSGTRRTFQWVVRGQPGTRIELKLASQKSGSESTTLTLR